MSDFAERFQAAALEAVAAGAIEEDERRWGERERIIDARVQRRLATDRAYKHAESAEAQAARELAISDEEADKVHAELGDVE